MIGEFPNYLFRLLAALLSIGTISVRADAPAVHNESPGGSGPMAVNPVDWKEPHEMPPLPQGMEAEPYHKALAEAIKRVDMEAMKRPDEPLPAIKMTTDFDAPWNPQIAYWHSSQRDPKWDPQMFVACTVFDTEPQLAEAALSDAAHAGYKGWLLPAIAARIAFNEWRFDDTLNFGSFALADAPADRRPIIARWMYAAAKADYKWNVAQQLSATYPLVDKDEIDRLHEAARAYLAIESHPRPEPLAALSGLSEVDLRAKVATIHVPGSIKSPEQTNGFKKTGRLMLQAPNDRNQLFAFGPKAADVDFTAHFQFHLQGKKNSQWDRGLEIVLVDPADHGEMQCSVSFSSNGLVDVEASGPEVGITEFPPPKWRKEGGTIRIIALGPDVEVFVDDKRAYYGPIRASSSTRQLAFMVQAVGVHAEVSQVSWKKIESKEKNAMK